MTDEFGPEPEAVGVRILDSPDEHADVGIYAGVSYCDAVRLAGLGQALRVLPGSIEVCRWAPAVLGLKSPEDRFEARLAPKLPFPTKGLLLAPVKEFPGRPQVVIVRASPGSLAALIQYTERAVPKCRMPTVWDGHQGRLEWSAVPLLASTRTRSQVRRVLAVNQLLAALARSPAWQILTRRLFRSRWITAGFEQIISHTLADMSVCRNSTVIPLLTGKVNLSLFCTGGITWGRNSPSHWTSGWPWAIYRQATLAETVTEGEGGPF